MSGQYNAANLWVPQGRRSTEQIREQADSLLSLLRERAGMRADELAAAKDVPVRYLERPLKLLRSEQSVYVSGEKRWMTYTASDIQRRS